jgi:hypothetical protein
MVTVLVADSQNRGEKIWKAFRQLGCNGGWRTNSTNAGKRPGFFNLVLIHVGNEFCFSEIEVTDAVMLRYAGHSGAEGDGEYYFNRPIDNEGISSDEAEEIVAWLERDLVAPLPSLLCDKLADDDFLSGCLLWLEALEWGGSGRDMSSRPPVTLLAEMRSLSADMRRELVGANGANAVIEGALNGHLPAIEVCRAAKVELSEVLSRRLGND